MSWENLIKRKKEPYTQESWASKKRRLEREEQKRQTEFEIDRMAPSILNLQMKNFQFEDMSRQLDQLYHMFKYFKEVYKRDFPNSGPQHIQTCDKAMAKIEELFDLAATLPSLYTKDEMDEMEMEDY